MFIEINPNNKQINDITKLHYIGFSNEEICKELLSNNYLAQRSNPITKEDIESICDTLPPKKRIKVEKEDLKGKINIKLRNIMKKYKIECSNNKKDTLKNKRNQLKLSLKQVEIKTNISSQTIYDYEHHKKQPSYINALILANLYKCEWQNINWFN